MSEKDDIDQLAAIASGYNIIFRDYVLYLIYVNTLTPPGVDAWLKGGNTVGSLKNLGTIDAFDLPFIVNSVEKMRLKATSGFLGVGTNSPDAKVHAYGRIAADVNLGSIPLTGDQVPFYAIRQDAGNPNYTSGMQFIFEVGGGTWGIGFRYATNFFQLLGSSGMNVGFGFGASASATYKFVFLNGTGFAGINRDDPTSNIDVNGSVAFKSTAVSADTTLTSAHCVVYVDADGKTITLPNAVLCPNRIYTIKLRVNAVASTTINTNGGNIDTAATYTINNLGLGILNKVTVQSDGTNYNILST